MLKISDDIAIIQTLDFFTPISEDPRLFGEIAAANSLSDVYAMGGSPISAMNILCFPGDGDLDLVYEILAGAADKCREANCPVVGGHSVDDKLIKFGLSVTGTVHPSKIWRNSTACEGDILILNKPLGTGIIVTSALAEMATKSEILSAYKNMTTLNKYAKDIACKYEIKAKIEKDKEYKINSCTDVTGFGLGGHLYEMAKAANLSFSISSNDLPLLEGAVKYASFGLIPTGAWKNQKAYDEKITFSSYISDELKNVIFDPQTSGGLLFSVPESTGDKLLKMLLDEGVSDSKIIGTVDSFSESHIKFL